MKKTLVAVLVVCAAVAAAPLHSAEPAATKHGLMTVDSAWVKAMLANDAAACAVSAHLKPRKFGQEPTGRPAELTGPWR